MSDEAREVLRGVSPDDTLKVSTEEGEEFTLHLASPVFYEEPDRYGSGEVDVSVELDTDEHDVPGEYPTCTGDLRATTSATGEWGDLTLAIWDPELTNDGEIVRDAWQTLGVVTGVEVLA